MQNFALRSSALKLIVALEILVAIESSFAATPAAGVAPRYDSAGLGSAAAVSTSPTPPPVQKRKIENKSKSVSSDERLLDIKAQKELVATIDSLTLILKQTTSGPVRNQILMNRATALNRYGRQRVLAQKTYVLSDEIKKYFRLAIKDAEEILKAKDATLDHRIRARDIAGTSYLYLEQELPAREQFLEELKLNPPGEKAGRIGLMIAEQYFDEGNFNQAIQFYTNYYPKMIPQWKELAIYKLGWCMINLNQFDKAENYFLKIAHSQSVSGIGRDAIRDLAYITSSKPGLVPKILETEAKIPNPVDRLNYLSDARAVLEGLNFIGDHMQIADRILQLEKNPEKRVEVLLACLRLQKKQYANATYYQAYEKLIRSEWPQAKKYADTVEVESENIFKAFLDSFVGRVKSLDSEPMLPADVLAKSQLIVQDFQKYFSAYPHFLTVVELWQNVSLDQKNWEQVDLMTEIVLSDEKRFASATENAYLNQIAALDQLHKDPARRALRVKSFVEKFPQAKQWLPVAQIYSHQLLEVKDFDNAIPVLQKISETEPSEENFYQLQFARFSKGDYQSVTEDKRNQTFTNPQSKVRELYRESALKLAEAAKDKADPSEYRARIEEFIRLSSDPAKARIARIDYFQFLIKSQAQVEVNRKLAALPFDERKNAVYEPIRDQLWTFFVEAGQFENSVPVANTKQRAVMSAILTGKDPSEAQFNALSVKEQDYFLGIYSLLKPSFAISWLKKRNLASDENSKAMLALALKVERDQWQLVRTPDLQKLLGKDYAFTETKQLDLLLVEKNAATIRFPELAKLSAGKQSKLVQANITNVQYVRSLTLKAISGKSPEVQVRVLTTMQQLEQKMGDYLVNSPVPTGLSPEQIEQYKTGLKSAAEEFFEQSKQFEILSSRAKNEIAKSQEFLSTRLYSTPDMSRWPWPEGAAADTKLTPIFTLAKNGLLAASIVLLDYLRPNLNKDETWYFTMRSGLILHSKPNDALRLYLFDELERNQQSGLIQTWGKLVNRPEPGAKS